MNHLKSPQFAYAAFEAGASIILIALAEAAAILTGTVSLREAAAASILAAIPILNRLKEGVKDSMRAQSGSAIPSDVQAVNPSPVIPSPAQPSYGQKLEGM